MFQQIGVECKVEVIEFGSFISRTTAGEHDMAYFGWTTSSADADYSYYSLEHSTQQGAAGNRSFIADPEVDALIEEARTNSDDAVRTETYKELASNWMRSITTFPSSTAPSMWAPARRWKAS